MKYIDADKLKTEIERLKSIEYPCDNSQQATGFFNALDRMKDFLDTLPDEECFADVGKTSGVPKKERPKVYEATCVDFDDDGTPIFYGDGKVPDLELDDKITFRVWWKKKK